MCGPRENRRARIPTQRGSKEVQSDSRQTKEGVNGFKGRKY